MKDALRRGKSESDGRYDGLKANPGRQRSGNSRIALASVPGTVNDKNETFSYGLLRF